MTPTAPAPDDRLTGRALDMLCGEVADQPGLADDEAAFARAVAAVVERLDPAAADRAALRRTLLATRGQIAGGGS